MGHAAKQYRKEKAAHERRIFAEFCAASRLAPDNITQPDPPDIIADLDGRGTRQSLRRNPQHELNHMIGCELGRVGGRCIDRRFDIADHLLRRLFLT